VFVENLAGFLSDFGVPAIFSAGTVTVLFDTPGQDILSGRVQSDQYEITYRTADKPNLAYGVVLSIAGSAYTVLSSNPIDDGAFSRAVLEAN
jgi:hypothetical protein